MSYLETLGAEVALRRARKFAYQLAAGVVDQVNTHITNEMEKIMSELNRLSDAVDRELADDAAQNQLIAELKSQLEAAQAAAADAAAGEADAEARLNEALAAAVSAAERLESNDPVSQEQPQEPPVDEEPVPEEPV